MPEEGGPASDERQPAHTGPWESGPEAQRGRRKPAGKAPMLLPPAERVSGEDSLTVPVVGPAREQQQQQGSMQHTVPCGADPALRQRHAQRLRRGHTRLERGCSCRGVCITAAGPGQWGQRQGRGARGGHQRHACPGSKYDRNGHALLPSRQGGDGAAVRTTAHRARACVAGWSGGAGSKPRLAHLDPGQDTLYQRPPASTPPRRGPEPSSGESGCTHSASGAPQPCHDAERPPRDSRDRRPPDTRLRRLPSEQASGRPEDTMVASPTPAVGQAACAGM
jgi:hypothetical protein